MLQTGQYDVLEFSMPVEGMNQNISPDILPPSFACMLENIIAKPLGEGQVRFGTEEIVTLPNPEAAIIRQFPFVKPDGGKQILLYVQEYELDEGAKDFKVDSPFCFSFNSPENFERYARDTAIKVGYQLNGAMTLYDAVACLEVAWKKVARVNFSWDKEVTVTLRQNAIPQEAVITAVSYPTGSIYCYDLESGSLSPVLKENLSIACIPRHASFMGKLLICNGVDRVLSWDGATLEELYEFVEEEGVCGFAYNDRRYAVEDVPRFGSEGTLRQRLTPPPQRQFSFTVSPDAPSFDINNYKVGNKLKVIANGVTTCVEIAAKAYSEGTVTITATADFPDFVQDFMGGSDPLLLGPIPRPGVLNRIQDGQLGLFLDGGKLYGKTAGKDRIEIKHDFFADSWTAKGLSPNILDRIKKSVAAPGLAGGFGKALREFSRARSGPGNNAAALRRMDKEIGFLKRDYLRRKAKAGAKFEENPVFPIDIPESPPPDGISPADMEALRGYIAAIGYMKKQDKPLRKEMDLKLFYQAWPPKFSFLFVAHDRLWALGEGAAGLEYRTPSEALRVYYARYPNTVTGWFNPLTRAVPSLDLSAKHGEPDNLEAICLIGNCIAFMGRKKTQVYQGQSPLPPGEGGDFAFHSILPTGVIHGDLLVELANDVFFISPTGLQSFSTLNVARQFAATSLDAVDPLIQHYAASLAQSNINYRACSSFKYEAGTLAGFKIGNNKVLCSLFSTTLHSWSMFSGDFEKAASYLTFGNGLYLSSRNKVYRYADGHDGNPPRYGDQGGEGLIPFSWTLPVIADAKGRRFANKRYEIQLDYPSSFALRQGADHRPENQVNIGVSGDLPKSYAITSPCRFELRGDVLQGIPLTQGQASSQDSLGFRFEQPFSFFKVSMMHMRRVGQASS